MDEACAKLAITRAKVEAAYAASCAEMRDAGTPSSGVALVGVDGDAA